MNQNNVIKVANTYNLPTLNIKSQLSMNIDSNSPIKQVINIETCLIEAKTESMNGKAIIKGVIGVKVIYIDYDNMFNTISDTINFTETLNSDKLTTDCQIAITNSQFVTDFNNDEKLLKLNLDGNIECFCNLNNGLNCLNDFNNSLITKKTILPAWSCVQKIDKSSTYNFEFKVDGKINKMLSCESKLILDDNKCYDGYVVISGQIINSVICEIDGEPNCLKLYSNSTPFKCELEANSCDAECVSDLTSYINMNNTQISTEIEDNYTKFDFEYSIITNGYIYKTVNVDIIQDAYSLDSELELISGTYNICERAHYIKTSENVDSEISLAEDINIDEILGMVNTSSSITQYVINDNNVLIEGVINGNLLYLDENRDVKNLFTQLPYSISIKQDISNEICGARLNVVPTACKCKIKRGNILTIDYEICVSGTIYTQNSITLIENIKYGKPFNYSDIAFQIYLARTGESSWELCKRLHITNEQLCESNKETPTTYAGGEKIIVYR